MFYFQGLEMGAVDILIVWENLEISRLVLKNHQTDGKWMFKNIIFTFLDTPNCNNVDLEKWTKDKAK